MIIIFQNSKNHLMNVAAKGSCKLVLASLVLIYFKSIISLVEILKLFSIYSQVLF